MENNYIVYMHVSPSDKRYIGITSQKPERRWKNGIGYKSNEHFYRAIEKYGWDNFQHIIIAKGLTKEEAEWLEIELIREWGTTNFKKGYNKSKGGESNKGYKHTEEWKIEHGKKVSGENNWLYGKGYLIKGENNPNYGENPNLKGEKNPFYGRHHTEETKEKIREKIEERGGLEGKNNPNAKSVICITTMLVFNTLKEAGEFYNIDSKLISRCCNNKQNYCGKLKDGTKLIWMYYKDYLKMNGECKGGL